MLDLHLTSGPALTDLAAPRNASAWCGHAGRPRMTRSVSKFRRRQHEGPRDILDVDVVAQPRTVAVDRSAGRAAPLYHEVEYPFCITAPAGPGPWAGKTQRSFRTTPRRILFQYCSATACEIRASSGRQASAHQPATAAAGRSVTVSAKRSSARPPDCAGIQQTKHRSTLIARSSTGRCWPPRRWSEPRD